MAILLVHQILDRYSRSPPMMPADQTGPALYPSWRPAAIGSAAADHRPHHPTNKEMERVFFFRARHSTDTGAPTPAGRVIGTCPGTVIHGNKGCVQSPAPHPGREFCR